ncbi:unnamed protein product [Prorocentrum cordatum]|uniref:Tetratricopeptide repeat protein n=1 Tax=Prorocentrum cordatum TaxID=2364126 RepID=A0ABN9YF63_9DINO|nr:unnamed protein product [Polarella glacialis]
MARSRSRRPRQHAATDSNLKRFFERGYHWGGAFEHPDYCVADGHCWEHRGTGIRVWRDAIDLSGGRASARVVFHYTSPIAFDCITAPEREAEEVWASLVTEGEGANAWWGKGVYTVPLAPHQWDSVAEILDNNFRNMMARDVVSKGRAFVNEEYPPRVAFCVPILALPDSLYDVSVRPTPEMEAAGKRAGESLAGKLLDEPGKPRRCCVVLRVQGVPEVEVEGARSRLVVALRARAEAASERFGEHHRDAVDAAQRLGNVLLAQGSAVLERRERMLGPEHPDTLIAVSCQASLLRARGRLQETEPLYRRVLEASERTLGLEHRDTLTSVGNLASLLQDRGRLRDAETLNRRALEARDGRWGQSTRRR